MSSQKSENRINQLAHKLQNIMVSSLHHTTLSIKKATQIRLNFKNLIQIAN